MYTYMYMSLWRTCMLQTNTCPYILLGEVDALIQASEHAHKGVCGDRVCGGVEPTAQSLQLIEVCQLGTDTLSHIHQLGLWAGGGGRGVWAKMAQEN